MAERKEYKNTMLIAQNKLTAPFLGNIINIALVACYFCDRHNKKKRGSQEKTYSGTPILALDRNKYQSRGSSFLFFEEKKKKRQFFREADYRGVPMVGQEIPSKRKEKKKTKPRNAELNKKMRNNKV
eukprot:TRINITY_DN6059_c4_g1_i1.p1 TRINITY_DN6059_c4_g1~~TRINITY_DN6059_c4_g1_i1.p1  ORF type:complete len:127 (-),score=10.93 TRINITY_DN6059_c4_g1_i1:248-628(-)